MNYRASKTSVVNLATDAVIGAGENFTVFGIVISNPTTNAVEVEAVDGSGNIKIPMTCHACDSLVMDIEFIADKGLTISGLGDAEVRVTVFHSHGG